MQNPIYPDEKQWLFYNHTRKDFLMFPVSYGKFQHLSSLVLVTKNNISKSIKKGCSL